MITGLRISVNDLGGPPGIDQNGDLVLDTVVADLTGLLDRAVRVMLASTARTTGS